jgi:hypothetical protein
MRCSGGLSVASTAAHRRKCGGRVKKLCDDCEPPPRIGKARTASDDYELSVKRELHRRPPFPDVVEAFNNIGIG